MQKQNWQMSIRVTGWAGWRHPISKKFLAVKRINMTSVHTKNQADMSKRSKVIHFLVVF